ncbi:MAG TPA: tetratricopeptide repeat protein, partial [Vicinamibacterales bacterium]|nr:tetratricopeptide repeat protein [Vicinamibacterales bacterium]
KAKPAQSPVNDPARKAVELFEKGFNALQQRQYAKASEILSTLVSSYPEEKELHERARVYLAVCERQVAAAAAPRTLEERLCAATLSINRGEAERALALLRDLERDHPDHDHVQYMLALGHAVAGESEKAVRHLRRAIELRPSNRLAAQQDVDLDGLRNDPAFLALMEGSRAPGRATR